MPEELNKEPKNTILIYLYLQTTLFAKSCLKAEITIQKLGKNNFEELFPISAS